MPAIVDCGHATCAGSPHTLLETGSSREGSVHGDKLPNILAADRRRTALSAAAVHDEQVHLSGRYGVSLASRQAKQEGETKVCGCLISSSAVLRLKYFTCLHAT